MVIVPSVTILCTGLLAVLPWGATEPVRLILAFLPLALVHYWSLRRPDLVAPALVFAVGLLVDLLGQGPLGYWALLALLVSALGRLQAAMWTPSTAVGRAMGFLAAMGVAGVAGWGIASLYMGETTDPQPFAMAVFVMVAIYPLIVLLLLPIDRYWQSERADFLGRGE